MGQTTSTPPHPGAPNSRANNGGNGGISGSDSHANDRRRVTFGGPQVDVIRPKSPRQHTTTGMSTRQSWPNINHPAETISAVSEIAGPSARSGTYHFHTTHGKNIVLSANHKLATRSGSFCNAIVFTHRPLQLQDPLHLQLIQSTQGWSGVIRFGFTCHCPDRIRPHMLPKYACPDLTVKPGYWVKALRETLATNGNVISFVVNSRGEVFYSINGEPYHMFFNGVDVSKPIWALIDVYGNTTGVKILDDFAAANNAFNVPPVGLHEYEHISRGPTSSASSQSLPSTTSIPPLSLPEGAPPVLPPKPVSRMPIPPIPARPLLPSQPLLDRIPFHSVHGINITFSDGLMSAERKNDVFNGGLVFICRSLKVDEAVFISIKTVNHRYIGHLGIGLTTCDPKVLKDVPIPVDVEHVYDRPEYWVLTREFEQPAQDEVLGVVFNSEGEVHLLNSDGTSRCCLMFVDTTVPLWMFFDIYGTTQEIQTQGYRNICIAPTGMAETAADSNNSNLHVAMENETDGATSVESFLEALSLSSSSSSPSIVASGTGSGAASASASGSTSSSKPKPPRPSKPPSKVGRGEAGKPPTGEEEECLICFEASVNSVFYKCGHTCCCFDCANKMRGSTCPICRAVIADVIKMYKP